MAQGGDRGLAIAGGDEVAPVAIAGTIAQLSGSVIAVLPFLGDGALMSDDDQDRSGPLGDPADPPWVSPGVAFALTSLAVGGALLGFWLYLAIVNS